MGNPLVLLTHPRSAAGEAALLAHPGWRCIYYDAVASVFVARDAADKRIYPTVDFAGRHFRDPAGPSLPDRPGAAFHDLLSLVRLGEALRRPEETWSWRIPSQLRALDRADLALRETPERHPAAWTLLGDCHWNLAPDRRMRPPDPVADWDPAAGMPWAQATYCYRRALHLDPAHAPALRSLYDAFRVRGMADAVVTVGERLVVLGEASAEQARDVARLGRALGSPLPPGGPPDLTAAVNALLRVGQVEEAARRVEEAEAVRPTRWTWALAQRVGPAYLHLGRPAEARRVWERAASPPSEAVRRCRLAETYWVERDFTRAAELYRQALGADPHLGEACWGLAVLEAERGEAGPALRACRQGLGLPLTDHQRDHLRALETMLAAFAAPDTPAGNP